VRFAKSVRITRVTGSLVDQLVRSGTSVGANYLEANDCESRRDFRHKIALCRKESREAKHWLRMLAVADDELAKDARPLSREARELNLIFSSILRNLDAESADKEGT